MQGLLVSSVLATQGDGAIYLLNAQQFEDPAHVSPPVFCQNLLIHGILILFYLVSWKWREIDPTGTTVSEAMSLPAALSFPTSDVTIRPPGGKDQMI